MATNKHQKYHVGKDVRLVSYSNPGNSEDWARSIGIKYAYTVELRDRGRYGFLLPASYIETTAKEAQAFVSTVSRAIFDEQKITKNKSKAE